MWIKSITLPARIRSMRFPRAPDIINAKDNDGQTALMVNCIHCESMDLVNFMLENGADLQLTTNNGKGIFDFIKLNQHDMSKKLLDVIGTKYLQTDEVLPPLNL